MANFGSSIYSTTQYLDGESLNYSALPAAAGNSGKYYIVKTGQGLWLINRKPAGIYYSDGSSWSYLGRSEQTFYDSNFKLGNAADNSKQMKWDLTAITTDTTRTITMPDSDVDLGDIADKAVTTDATLTGDGTAGDPLTVAQNYILKDNGTDEQVLTGDLYVDGNLRTDKGGLDCQVGEKIYIHVKAAQNIAAGQLVYLVSSSSNLPTCAVASASNSTGGRVIAISESAITSGQTGYVVLHGEAVMPVPGASFTEGDELYLGTDGYISKTIPALPNYKYKIGYVLKTDNTAGHILFTPVMSDHNALANILAAGTGVTYGHVNQSAQTFIGQKTFAHDVTCESGLFLEVGTETIDMADIVDKLETVAIDGTLTGNGTAGSPLSVKQDYLLKDTGTDPQTLVSDLTIDGHLELIYGATINEFSIDGTLAGNSDSAVPTEKAVKTYVDTAIPAGSIQMFGGAAAPTGWFLCDGAAVNRTTYASLFTAIGTTWGIGNGSTTFNVPDLRGAFPRGVGTHGTNKKVNDSYFAGQAIGVYANDISFGHKHNPSDDTAHDFIITNEGNTIQPGAGTSATFLAVASVASSVAITDGTNGTPRNGAETAPFSAGVNFIIKY
jgi:microcystin-dependent protein